MKLLLKISILAIFCVLCTPTYAQVPTSIDGVTIESDVSNPRPGEVVEVFIESFSFDLNASSMVWTVDGKPQSQGVGIKKIDITAPKIGKKVNVSVRIKGSDGREIQKSIIVKSGFVDIIWETDGYTPPFFKGKVPFSFQNTVKFTAIPHLSKSGASEIDPKDLVYVWKMDGKFVPNGQGYGKQGVEISNGDIPKPLDISVEVSNREQTEYTKGGVLLGPSEPSLSFYEEDALYGILFNKTLSDNTQLKNSEMKVLSVPYGFNLNNSKNSYVWSINNIEQSGLGENRSITIRPKQGIEGSSSIGLSVRSIENILQGADAKFAVYFKKKQDTSNIPTF